MKDISSIHSFPKAEKYSEEVRKAAQDLEGIFYGILMKSMRQTVPHEGQEWGGQVYTELLDREYADLLARHSLSPLAQGLCEELSQKQGQIHYKKNQDIL